MVPNHLATVPYGSTFLLFESEDTTFYKYDGAEEEFQPMPVSLTEPIGDYGTPVLVSLDIFPATIMTPGLTGKNTLFFEERKN